MGLLAFAIRRCADVIIPGSGAILDLFDVLDSIEALKDGYDAQEILDAKNAVEDAAESHRELCGKKISRQACSICRKTGHNKRTCSRR
jgi:hypothetical protein